MSENFSAPELKFSKLGSALAILLQKKEKMLFISTAIAFTFLPTILSAPASAGTPTVNDFDDDFSSDFSVPMKDAALIDDENDNEHFKMAMGRLPFEDEDDEDDSLVSFNDQAQGGKISSDSDFAENDDEVKYSGSFKDEYEEDDYSMDDVKPLPTTTDGKSVMKTKPTPTTYFVMVKTGDKWLSGSHARPFLQFADANGNTVNSFLNKNTWHGRGSFKRREVDFFKVSTFAQLDDVCIITLGDDFSGFSPSWYE